MTTDETRQIMVWLIGTYSTWFSRTASEQAEATTELYLRLLKPLEFARTFRIIQHICISHDWPPQPSHLTRAFGIESWEDREKLLDAIKTDDELYRIPEIGGWQVVRRGLAPPDAPLRQLTPPPTEHNVRQKLARHGRGSGARRLGTYLPPSGPGERETT